MNTSSANKMVNTAGRRKARHYAMQALYEWRIAQNDPPQIVAQFINEYDMTNVDVDYFRELVQKISLTADDIDSLYVNELTDRSLAELDPITQALLRIGAYELKHRIDVPFKVSISEAVSLAKKFGATDSHKFINGVLDKVSMQLRVVERK